MPNIIFPFSRKLLAPMSTRVPLEVQELVDELAGAQSGARAKWIREAIELKIEVDLGQSSIEALKKSKNTTYSSVFTNVYKTVNTFFQTLKKPEVAIRTFRVQ